MSKQSHTPGPWTAVQGQGAHHRDVYIRAGERKPGEWPAVARCCSSRVGSFATVKANGQLIAAAPDLLAACEGMLENADKVLAGLPVNHEAARWIIGLRVQARAAIAKARGEA